MKTTKKMFAETKLGQITFSSLRHLTRLPTQLFDYSNNMLRDPVMAKEHNVYCKADLFVADICSKDWNKCNSKQLLKYANKAVKHLMNVQKCTRIDIDMLAIDLKELIEDLKDEAELNDPTVKTDREAIEDLATNVAMRILEGQTEVSQ